VAIGTFGNAGNDSNNPFKEPSSYKQPSDNASS
jgi:hypothetical protein